MHLRKAYFVMFGTCVIGDMNNPTTGPSSLPATLHINASECPRPAWQHCCHRVFTCQILMNMHCVLCFLSRAWPSPFTPPPLPHTSFSPLCMVHSLPPNPTPPHPPPRLTPSTPSPSLTPLYVLLHGLWPPRRLAWHWPPTPQDHSGTLGAEEFKACLISLGFDIANDAQVLNRSSPPSAARSLTGFFFCTFPPLYFYPPLFSLYSHLYSSSLLSKCPS